MGVAEYSKRQLKTTRFPISKALIYCKLHPSDYAHLLQHKSQTALPHYAGYCHR